MSETQSLTSEQLIERLRQNVPPGNWMDIFRNKGINGKTVLSLSNDQWNKELEDNLGIKTFGIRKKIFKQICELKKEVSKDEEISTTDEEFEEVPCTTMGSTFSQLSWLPEGEQLHRLQFKRCPKEFRAALKSSPQLTMELSSGALVFVPMQARDYVERLVAIGNEDVANLDGKDVIASTSLVAHVEEVVANARCKTKLSRTAPITANASKLTPQPSAAAPNLSKDTLGKRVETVQNTFIHVSTHVSACAQSVASSTDNPYRYGERRNPRRKVAESRALGVLDDEDDAVAVR